MKRNPNPSTYTPILRKYKRLNRCITIKVSMKMIRIRLCVENFFGSSSSSLSFKSMSIHVFSRNYIKRLWILRTCNINLHHGLSLLTWSNIRIMFITFFVECTRTKQAASWWLFVCGTGVIITFAKFRVRANSVKHMARLIIQAFYLSCVYVFGWHLSIWMTKLYGLFQELC